MPVEVPIKTEPNIFKKAAFDEMQKYKEEYLIPVSNYFDYKLICKNGTIVRNLPASSQPFVLREYRKELGMLYSRICLYLMEYEASDYADDLIRK